MRTVVVGNRKLSRHLLEQLLDENWEVVGAIVSEGELATEQANFVPFDELVAEADCELHRTADINSPETRNWLETIAPDVCLCGGWSQIIDEELLDIPEDGFFGFHSSKLPRGRGGAPVNWSLISGAQTVWISLFEYVPAVDAGEVLEQGSVPVETRDDVSTVFDSLAAEACRLASSARDDLAKGTTDPEPQSLAEATYRPRRQPQDGLIDWEREPEAVFNWVRAQTKPYPGAYTFHDGRKLTVWRGEPVDASVGDAEQGEVVRVVTGDGVDVRAGAGVFRLRRVQASGEPSRWADRFAREENLGPGDRLGLHHAPDEWLYTGMQRLLDSKPFETNLAVGEEGTLELISASGSRHEVGVEVAVNDQLVFDERTVVTGTHRNTVAYTFSERGSHTISITFDRDGVTTDTRYLKVFVTES